MAARKTLKSRIDALFTALGGPEADRPNTGEIKTQLFDFAAEAEALENGEATREAEEKIASLEAALEQSDAENNDLRAALKAVNVEIETLRKEQKEREKKEKKREMPDIQFEILKGLPNEGEGGGATLKGISERAKVPDYEAAVHLDKLEKAGLAKKGLYERLRVRAIVWHRTIPGSELILAKRLAGETEEQKTRKHADLPPIQHEILLLIAAGENDGERETYIASKLEKTLGLIRYNLKQIEEADLAGDPGLPDYGAGRCYYLRDKGAEYLAERDLL